MFPPARQSVRPTQRDTVPASRKPSRLARPAAPGGGSAGRLSFERVLDPRAPLVLDTRDLSRRPGSQVRLHRTVPAPVDLGLPLLGVLAAAPVALDLRLEAVVDGVLVTGSATAQVSGECSRCLDVIADEITAEFQELYSYPEALPSDLNDDEPGELMAGDLLDLEPVLRDALVLGLPLAPLCTPDCPGLCPSCGARLAETGPGHEHAVLDSRWAALGGLADPAAGVPP